MISGFVLPLGSCTRPVFSICSSSVAVSHRTSVIALQRAKTGTKWLPPVCSGADTASTAMQKKIPATDAVQSNVSFVSYDGSTFVLEYSASVLKKPARLIIDPWLDDDLVFGRMPAFYRAKKELSQKPLSHFGDFDCIIITQHLPDHCHQPTLAKLSRTIPVVAPTCAVDILRNLQYENVIALSPGKSCSPLSGKILSNIKITAGKGSTVGPPWSKPQLAYLFEFPTGVEGLSDESTAPIRIYHETHGNHDPKFLREITADNQRLDAVISPVVSTRLPLLLNYPVVQGIPQFLDLCRQTAPRACIPFDNLPSSASGLLVNFTETSGGFDEFERKLRVEPRLSGIRVIRPETGKAVPVADRPLGPQDVSEQ